MDSKKVEGAESDAVRPDVTAVVENAKHGEPPVTAEPSVPGRPVVPGTPDGQDTDSVVTGEMLPAGAHPYSNRLWLTVGIVIGVLLIAGLAAWQVTQYQYRKTLRSPAKQAQAYGVVNDTTKQQQDIWQYSQEIQTLQSYLATKPLDQYRDKAQMSLGKAYADNKQYDQAVSSYKTLESNPTYQLDAWRGIGKAYLDKGDKADAAIYLNKVIAATKTKTDPESLFQQGLDQAQLTTAESAQ